MDQLDVRTYLSQEKDHFCPIANVVSLFVSESSQLPIMQVDVTSHTKLFVWNGEKVRYFS